MNYQHLTYFRELCHSRSYQEAADRLFITQPTLSRAIAALEYELGVKLFEKSGRTVKITPYGTKFLEYVEAGIDMINSGIDELHLMSERVSGLIKISSIYGFTYKFLPQILSAFSELYPDISFRLMNTGSQTALDRVYRGEADFGILLETSQMIKYPDLEFHFLKKLDTVVAVSASSPLSKRDSVSLRELPQNRMASFPKTSAMLYKTIDMFKEAGLEFKPGMTISDDQSIINMIQNGNMISCLLRPTVENMPGICAIEIEDAIEKSINIFFCTRRDHRKSASFDTFKEFLINWH